MKYKVRRSKCSTVWSTEFPRCSPISLQLSFDTAALCLH